MVRNGLGDRSTSQRLRNGGGVVSSNEMSTLTEIEEAAVRLSVSQLDELIRFLSARRSQMESDPERFDWLEQSENRLRETWDNDADEVFNELLSK